MKKNNATSIEQPFLVVVDIQPGYQEGCHLLMPEIVDKINNTEQNIIFFFVGRELDLDSKTDVIGFLLEHGVDENRIDGMRFIEKDYGFFRSWMDNQVPDNIVIDAVRHMKENSIYDSREFEEEDWHAILKGDPAHDHIVFEDNIYYPGFDGRMFDLDAVNGFELVGGGRDECLKEIELYLKALNKDVTVNERLCYGNERIHYESDFQRLKRIKKHGK